MALHLQYAVVTLCVTYANFRRMDNVNTKNCLVATINDYLNSQGIACDMVAEDQATVYWSYQIRQHRSLGWISIYDSDENQLIGASVNFARLRREQCSAATLALLEANSFLHGIAYATQAHSLIVVGFSEEIRFLTPELLTFRLQQIHMTASFGFRQFVNYEDLFELLPTGWFQNGEVE